MSQRVHLVGYSGREPQWLLSAAVRLDAVVFDIRYSPRSRVPAWSRKRLADLFGDRYQHVPAWGNLHYRGDGPIQIADFAAGLAAFDAEHRPVVLMCVCKETAGCHREVVAKLIQGQRRIVAVELDTALAALQPKQATLFGEGIR